MTAGSAVEECGCDTPRVLERGTVVVHPAGVEHALRFHAGGCSFLRIDLVLSRVRLPGSPRLLTLRADDPLITRFTHELRASDAARDTALRAAVLRLVAKLESGDAAGPVADSARRFIEANYHDRIALRDVALSLKIDPVRLAREFRRAYGWTVGEAIRAARVRHAASMLCDSACEMREIAAACGFFDASHLIRSFERTHGVKP
ncbi:MAG: helix-turn-helix domain-containing protein, partial [Thermoanaerobaculia bacterium]